MGGYRSTIKRDTEDIVIAREYLHGKIMQLVVFNYHNSKLRRDCLAHLAEMRNDPLYVPVLIKS